MTGDCRAPHRRQKQRENRDLGLLHHRQIFAIMDVSRRIVVLIILISVLLLVIRVEIVLIQIRVRVRVVVMVRIMVWISFPAKTSA